MLVLTRKINETICVGDNIKITITGLKGNQVRVGISAPPDVRIDREEVVRRIQQWTELDHSEHGEEVFA